MDGQPPLVSIVLPTFNRARWLPEAVASIRAQTLEDWRLLIVDDGSTDGSVEALPDDPRIRAIVLPHTGHLATLRQAGLSAAGSEYVAFLDSDDRWHPGKLAAQVSALQDWPDCGWCHGPTQVIDAAGRRLRGAPHWSAREGDLTAAMLEGEAGVALQAVLVRRPLATRVGFDPGLPFGEDYDFVLRLAIAAQACAVDFPVADIREHPDRTTHTRHDHHLGFALSFWKCRRLVARGPLRRRCRRRAWRALRHYLAHARAAGTLRSDLARAVRLFARTRAVARA